MGTNRYMVAAQSANNLQPFQVPFKELAYALESKQKIQDENEAAANSLLDATNKIKASTPYHKEVLNQYNAGLNQWVDDISNKYKGDFTNLGPEIKRKARQVAYDLTTGDLGVIQSTTDQYGKLLKDKEELEKSGKYNTIWSQRLGSEPLWNKVSSLDRTNGRDKSGNLIGFTNTGIPADVDEIGLADKTFGKIPEDTDKSKIIDLKTGLIHEHEYATIAKPKIYQAALNDIDHVEGGYNDRLNWTANQKYNMDPNNLSVLKQDALEFYANANPMTDKNKRYSKELTLQNAKNVINSINNPVALARLSKANEYAKIGEKYFKQKISTGLDIDNQYLKSLQDNAPVQPQMIHSEVYPQEVDSDSTTLSAIDNMTFNNGKLSGGKGVKYIDKNGKELTPTEALEKSSNGGGEGGKFAPLTTKPKPGVSVLEGDKLVDIYKPFIDKLRKDIPGLENKSDEQVANIYKNTVTNRTQIANAGWFINGSEGQHDLDNSLTKTTTGKPAFVPQGRTITYVDNRGQVTTNNLNDFYKAMGINPSSEKDIKKVQEYAGTQSGVVFYPGNKKKDGYYEIDFNGPNGPAKVRYGLSEQEKAITDQLQIYNELSSSMKPTSKDKPIISKGGSKFFSQIGYLNGNKDNNGNEVLTNVVYRQDPIIKDGKIIGYTEPNLVDPERLTKSVIEKIYNKNPYRRYAPKKDIAESED